MADSSIHSKILVQNVSSWRILAFRKSWNAMTILGSDSFCEMPGSASIMIAGVVDLIVLKFRPTAWLTCGDVIETATFDASSHGQSFFFRSSSYCSRNSRVFVCIPRRNWNDRRISSPMKALIRPSSSGDISMSSTRLLVSKPPQSTSIVAAGSASGGPICGIGGPPIGGPPIGGIGGPPIGGIGGPPIGGGGPPPIGGGPSGS